MPLLVVLKAAVREAASAVDDGSARGNRPIVGQVPR
jgi:hypothetical protein